MTWRDVKLARDVDGTKYLDIFTGTIGTNLASFECYYSYSVIARWYHPFQIPRVYICYLYGRFRLFRSLFAVYYASGQRHVVFSSSNRSSPKLTMAAPVLPLDPNPDALAALAAPLAPPVACGATPPIQRAGSRETVTSSTYKFNFLLCKPS